MRNINRKWYSSVILVLGLILVSNCVGLATVVPIGYWNFNDESDAGKDSSSHGQNGALMNGAARVEVEQFAGALKLDGINDYMEIKDDPSQSGMSKLRLEAWINPSNSILPPIGYHMVVINKWGPFAESDDSYVLCLNRIDNTSELRPYFSMSDGTADGTVRLEAPVSIPFNQWTNLIAVYDGLRGYIYVNKEQVAVSNVIPGLIVQDTYMPIKIGLGQMDSSGIQNAFGGMIDEVKIAIPEPATLCLLGFGMLSLLLKRKA